MTARRIYTPAQIKHQKRKRMLRCWQLYLFLLIPVIWVLIFKYVPMVGVQLAFRKYNLRDGIWGSKWVWFDQFKKFFGSYQFGRVLPNTVRLSLYGLAANFPLPILLALRLNCMPVLRYKKFIQTVTYIPHFISTVVLVGLVFQVFHPIYGLYGACTKAITGKVPEDLFGIASAFPHFYVWSGVWKNMGWSSIIYMAALSAIDPSLHEAAQLDGASRFQRCMYVDFPCILPTATIMLILKAGDIMSVGFEKVYLMQNNLNLRTSEVISTYVYKVSIAAGGGDFSYGTAIGLFNSVINLLLLVIVNAFAKKFSETSLW